MPGDVLGISTGSKDGRRRPRRRLPGVDRGLAVVSAIAGWTDTRQILSSLVGQIVLYKFVQTSGDVWVYEGQRSFDYDAFAHGGVREILPAIGNWRR